MPPQRDRCFEPTVMMTFGEKDGSMLPSAVPSVRWSIPNCSLSAVKISRTRVASGPAFGSVGPCINTPNASWPASVTDSFWTRHLASSNAFSIWMARKSASGSLSTRRNTRDDGCLANSWVSSLSVASGIDRQATLLFRVSYLRSVSAACFSRTAALSLAFAAFSFASAPRVVADAISRFSLSSLAAPAWSEKYQASAPDMASTPVRTKLEIAQNEDADSKDSIDI